MAFVWEQRKLGEFVDKAVDNRGKTPPLDANGNHPLIEVAALGGVHPDYSKVEKYLSEDSFGNNLRAYIKKGDILFTTVGSIGLVSLMDSREEAAIAQNIVAFRAKENFVPEYLYALFSNEGNQYKAQRIVMGAVQPSIKVSQLVDVEYILANNVEEQRLIGEYFSYLDHLITLHQRKRVLRKCFFSIAWEQRKLGEVADIIGGGTPSTSYSDYWDGDIDWYAPAEISDQIFVDSSERKITKKGYENSSAKMLPVGAVLFTSRAGIGKTAILSRKGCTNQGFQSIVPHKDKLDSYFIFSRSEELKRYGETVGAGSTFVEVSGKQMANMELMLPENIEEQQVIGEYFKNLDHLITLHQCKFHFCKKNEVNAWEQRMVSELFRVTRGYVLAATQTETTKTDEKPYPVYSSQTKDKGLMGYYKDYLYEDAITWTTDGANAGTVNYRTGKFYCTNVCGVLLSNEVKANQMIAEALNRVAKGYVSYVGNPKLMNNVMADIVIHIPTQAEEREQLSSFFAKLDNLITLHQWECNINENTEGNDEKQRKPIKKLIISEGDLSLVDDMFLLHRMTFFVCYKYILLRLNVVKYKITIIIINNILYSIVSLLIIACYLIVINKQLIILIYVEISVVIIKGDDDYARIRS